MNKSNSCGRHVTPHSLAPSPPTPEIFIYFSFFTWRKIALKYLPFHFHCHLHFQFSIFIFVVAVCCCFSSRWRRHSALPPPLPRIPSSRLFPPPLMAWRPLPLLFCSTDAPSFASPLRLPPQPLPSELSPRYFFVLQFTTCVNYVCLIV